MVSLCLGITAFTLYFIYDINSFTWQKKSLHRFFLLGTLLLFVGCLGCWSVFRCGRCLAADRGFLLVRCHDLQSVFCAALPKNLHTAVYRQQGVPERCLCVVPSSGSHLFLDHLSSDGVGGAADPDDPPRPCVFPSESGLCMVSGLCYFPQNLLRLFRLPKASPLFDPNLKQRIHRTQDAVFHTR